MKKFTEFCDNHCVPYWRRAHRFLSVRALALQTAMLVAWAQMPDDLKQALPHWLLPAVAFFILLVGTAGAMYNQKGLKDAQSTEPH